MYGTSLGHMDICNNIGWDLQTEGAMDIGNAFNPFDVC